MNASFLPAAGTLVPFAAAFLSTSWIYGHVLRIAVEKDITDNPGARKLQKEPVPVLGGVAVAFGIIVAAVTGGAFLGMGALCPPACVLAVMLYTGVMDDILGLSPRLRIGIEILAVLSLACATGSCIDDFHGLWGIGRLPGWAALPLTVFAGVGIINAINLIDGVNGLCSGYCIFACAAFGAFFSAFGEPPGAFLAAACAGALLPFLSHNVFGRTSKMFLGDGGTLLMGTVMAFLVMVTLGGDAAFREPVPEGMGLVPFCLSVLSVPVFDTLRVMAVRMLRRRSPFKADRTHLHHQLFKVHFSHVGTTCTEIALNALVTGSWWLSYRLGASIDVQLYTVLAAGSAATFGLYGGIVRIRRRHPVAYRALLRFGDRTHVGHSGWFLRLRGIMDRGMVGQPSKNNGTNKNKINGKNG